MQTGFHDIVELLGSRLGIENFHFFSNFGADLFPGNLYERREVREGNTLSAVLVACHLRDDLGRDVAGCGKAVGLFNFGFADDSTVLQHVLEVYEVAVVHVLCEVVGIVKVDQTLLVGLYDVGRQQKTLG